MLKKRKIIEVGDIKAIVSSDLMRFKTFDAIYADVIEQSEDMPCCVKLLNDTTALIIRDKKLLQDMGLNSEERKAIYCHELGHCFSENQKKAENIDRMIFNEVDSDTFAIEQCDIDIDVLENALKKTYEYNIANIKNKPNLTQERLDKFVEEMTARKRNIERLKLKNKNHEERE